MKPVSGIEGERRLYPRPWDYNFYVMRKLCDVLEKVIRCELPTGAAGTVVEFGCGTRPRPLDTESLKRAAEELDLTDLLDV